MSLWVRIPLGDVMRFEPIIVKKKAPNRTFTGSVGYNLAEAVGFEPTNELPRYRISSAGRYDHFDTLPYFDVEKPLRSGHKRHAVRIAMTTSIHFLIENIYRVSAWFIIVYKIYFCNKFCTTWLLLLTICGFSMPTMLDGRENRRIIIYHIYY